MKYFSIKELCQSSTANTLNIKNTPTTDVEHNLTLLIDNILDPIRQAYGSAIHINSGYRCPELNAAVKGVSTSQHTKGQAADISVGDRKANKSLFAIIEKSGLPFDQLIDENNFQWVHISYDPTRNRKQVLRINK